MQHVNGREKIYSRKNEVKNRFKAFLPLMHIICFHMQSFAANLNKVLLVLEKKIALISLRLKFTLFRSLKGKNVSYKYGKQI
jgi:hypothetical protein